MGKLAWHCKWNIHFEHHYEYVHHSDPVKDSRIREEYWIIIRHYCECNAYYYTYYESTNSQYSWQPSRQEITTPWVRPYLGEEDPLLELLS